MDVTLHLLARRTSNNDVNSSRLIESTLQGEHSSWSSLFKVKYKLQEKTSKFKHLRAAGRNKEDMKESEFVIEPPHL